MSNYFQEITVHQVPEILEIINTDFPLELEAKYSACPG